MAKYKFKKYEFEDIRTEYYAFDATHTAPTATIPSRTGVKFVSNVLTATDDTIDNESVFMLAEDVTKDDFGFVYYIIENTNNLDEEE